MYSVIDRIGQRTLKVAAAVMMIGLCAVWSAAADTIPPDVVAWRAIGEAAQPGQLRDFAARFPDSPLAILATRRLASPVGDSSQPAQMPTPQAGADADFSHGVDVPATDEMRKHGVAVALQAVKLLAEPRNGAKAVADVEAEQVMTVLGAAEGGWTKVMSNGSTGFVAPGSIQQPQIEDAAFSDVKSPEIADRGPIAAASGSPANCIEKPDIACVLGQADALAPLIGDSDRVDTLASIAGVLFARGHVAAAESRLDAALTLARNTGESEFNDRNSNRVSPLQTIANDLVQFGQPRRALMVYAEAMMFGRLAHGKKSWQTDPDERAQYLTQIAGSLASNGFHRQARALFSEALMLAGSIPVPEEKGLFANSRREERLSSIATELVNSGDVERGVAVLADSIGLVSRMRYLNPAGFEDITRSLQSANLAAKVAAFGHFDLGIRMARNIGNPASRQKALAEIVKLLVLLDRTAANGLADEVMRIDAADGTVAEYLIQAGYVEPGLWVLDKYRSKLPQAQKAFEKFGTNDVVEALAGQHAFDRAIDIANTISDTEYYQKSICSIAEEMTKAGMQQERERLLASMKMGNAAGCADDIARVSGTLHDNKLSEAITAHDWKQVAAMEQDSTYTLDLSGVVTAAQQHAIGIDDARRIVRAVPSGQTAARSSALLALLIVSPEPAEAK